MVPAKTVHIGVFLPTGAQLLDFSCVDIFGTMSKEYMSIVAGTAEPTGAAHATTDTSATIGPLLPASVAAAAPPVRIYYITEHGPSGPLAVGDAAAAAMRANGTMDADKSMGHVQMTSSIQLRATHAITDAAVQPGALDILLVPGPDPRDTWNDAVLAFLRAHADATGADGKTKRTDILSVCTGILLCGAAGLLDGRTCTGPRGLQGQLKRLFPKAMFVGDKLRWVRDGNFWSCGAVTGGNDLVAAYCRDPDGGGRFFPRPLVEIACRMCEVGDRPQHYTESTLAMGLGFAWNIFRTWLLGFGKAGKKD